MDRAIRGSTQAGPIGTDRKSTRLNSSHLVISYAVFCLKKKKQIGLTLEAELYENLYRLSMASITTPTISRDHSSPSVLHVTHVTSLTLPPSRSYSADNS